jgi:hypothetical protein
VFDADTDDSSERVDRKGLDQVGPEGGPSCFSPAMPRDEMRPSGRRPIPPESLTVCRYIPAQPLSIPNPLSAALFAVRVQTCNIDDEQERETGGLRIVICSKLKPNLVRAL